MHTLSLVLALERRLRSFARVSARGEWTDSVREVPRRLSELTLGILGFGRIGSRFAAMAAPLFGRIVANDPYVTDLSDGVEPVAFEDLLAQSDVLSLHAPLTAETRTMVDRAALASLKPGTVLANTARGEMFDLDALVEALDSGHLGGVGLDVLDGEPPAADHPLRTHPAAILTPHVAFLSTGSLAHYELDPCRRIIEWQQTGRPATFVPLQTPKGPIDVRPR